MGSVAETRFGSPVLPVEAACAVLRARARSRGVALAAASSLDLAAAVVAADAWAALTGASTLERASGWGRPATAVVAAVLARAAGHPSPVVEAPLDVCPVEDELIRLAEYHREWAAQLVPGQAREVLLRAASDLLAAGQNTAFAGYASMLRLVAEEYSPEP